jgi:hypothetical protein
VDIQFRNKGIATVMGILGVNKIFWQRLELEG